jgi:hypothetical protein
LSSILPCSEITEIFIEARRSSSPSSTKQFDAMNGPKVRLVMKSAPVSEMTAHKLISRFLEREGQEEIALHENLTRLQTISQSLGSAKMQALNEILMAAPSTPSTKGTPTVHSKKKESSDTTTDKESKKRDKAAKSAEKEAKKLAKRERKEKRKREERDSNSAKKKQRRSVDAAEAD